MTPEYWQRLKELFNEAVEYEPAARARFLDEECAGDRALLAQVESLIASDEAAGDFIAAPAFVPRGAALPAEGEVSAGRRVGSYEIVRELGRGGMGAVYLAVRADAQFVKRVAVKIVKRGMDTDFLLRRFSRERQILAALDHPNIAKLLDGGATEDGLPYFVMEYVEGLPVTDYCDLRKLSVRERLELFRQVCSAVQYAHQNLVVHRDLKPSNILVTEAGTPKLLDFGIAKLLNPGLDAETVEQTEAAMRLMTPEYASPEQVRGLQITTASDVYSLGVLLYELLTGRRPYRLKSRTATEIMSAVCEREPERPSAVVGRPEEIPTDEPAHVRSAVSPDAVASSRDTEPARLRRALSGDLDTITIKALRKEPQRRYASAEQLSEDIRRYLVSLPVGARPDTLGYRAGKFVRRHSAGVVAAVSVVLALSAGMGTTVWQKHVAERQRARAEAESVRAGRRFDDLHELASSRLFEIDDAIEKLQGSAPVRELVAKQTLEYLDRLAADAGDDPSLRINLAIAYTRLGDIQGNPFYHNVGDTVGALESYRKAVSLAETLAAHTPEDKDVRHALWNADMKYGDILAAIGYMSGAAEYQGRAQAVAEAMSAANPGDDSARTAVGASLTRNGNLLLDAGQAAAALERFTKALAIFKELSAADPADDAKLRNVVIVSAHVGDALLMMGDAPAALRRYQEVIAIDEAWLAKEPGNKAARDHLVGICGYAGDAQAAADDLPGALKSYRKQLALYRELSDVDPTDVNTRFGMVQALSKIGAVMTHVGGGAKTRASYRRALMISQELAAQGAGGKGSQGIQPAICYKLGELHQAIASDARTSPGERAAHARAATVWYGRARSMYVNLRDFFSNRDDGTGREELSRRVAECDEALEKVKAQGAKGGERNDAVGRMVKD